MGDRNQRIYLERYVPCVDGPVIEVGSKDHGNTTSFRDLYSGNEYVGVDLEAGKNVDLLVDLTQDLDGRLQNAHFALGICCSVLEHTPQPWKMAENLSRLIRPTGRLYISVPWVFRYHAFPEDYFRFSFRAIEVLFQRFTWSDRYYSTTVENEFIEITPDADNAMKKFAPVPHGRRKYLPHLTVNMLGTKQG